MYSAPDALSAVQWPLASLLLASILARTDADLAPGLVVELRVSATRDAVPGLAVIEYELIDQTGAAVGGGRL